MHNMINLLELMIHPYFLGLYKILLISTVKISKHVSNLKRYCQNDYIVGTMYMAMIMIDFNNQSRYQYIHINLQAYSIFQYNNGTDICEILRFPYSIDVENLKIYWAILLAL